MSSSAMNTAVSGLRSQQTFMEVIANNISNSGTIGFKRGRMTFEESFSTLLQGASRPPGDEGGVNPLQLGSGSSIGSIDTVITQGAIQSTGNNTDIAIRGDGFFVVSDGQNDMFTRAGSFQWDSNGRLVIPFNGLKVQGRVADAEGVVDDGSPIQDIVVPFGTIDPAQQTTEVKFVGNLDSSAQPAGNIITTDPLYSREIAGLATDINGLFAKGDANIQITGMSSLSTTVNIEVSAADGTETKQTYTYVAEDTSATSKDFHTFDDLISEINNDFSSLMSVALNDSGALEFTNLDDPANTLNITSVNSVLSTALSAANGVVGQRTTDEFSHVAVGTDALTSLRNSKGEDLGLTSTDTIAINGNVGGEAIALASVNVDDGSGGSITFGDFIKEVSNSFGVTNVDGVQINSATGALVINADGGLQNEITGVNITTNAASSGGTSQVFDNVFDATVGNWSETQSAEDVTHSASVRVFDSLGNDHSLTLEFKKDVSLPNRWTWSITVPEPAEMTGGYSGTVAFDANGILESFSYDDGAVSLTFDPKNGADVPVEIDMNFGTLGRSDGISQFASTSTVIARNQDGYASGVLDNVVIDDQGTITGSFTNGNSRVIAKLVLATFNNPAGLLRVGDNTYDVSSNSGLPIYGFAGSSINATLTPGAVEMSNVDIAEEFTNMITAQRTFQANARTITTSDELMQETVNLKR